MDITILATDYIRAAQSIGTDATRYFLTGIHYYAKDGFLHAVSTNGTTLSVVRTQTPAPERFAPVTVTAPKDVLSAARRKDAHSVRICGDDDNTVTEVTDKAGFVFYKKITPKIDGIYPDFERVIPNFDTLKNKVVASFDPDLLTLCVNTVRTVNNKNVSLYQAQEDGPIVVAGEHPNAYAVLMPTRVPRNIPAWGFTTTAPDAHAESLV